MSLPIDQYAMIGDCHTSALIGTDGSIDWLCLPRFDSGACFAALLGTPKNGRWLLCPADSPTKCQRRYRGDTLILETDLENADGAVTIIDCMPPRDGKVDLVRVVVGRRGKVRMKMELIIRFDYGSIVPWVQRSENGIRAIAGPDSLMLDTPVELKGKSFTTVAEFSVSAGEEVPFVLTWYASHESPPPRTKIKEAIKHTETWWKEWASHCNYDGPWRDAVKRSLITLKALTFAPTGGMVAAPTTSLPEKIGGVRNWDYRFCWIRDSTFTFYSLISNGYQEEAKHFRDWLLRAVAGHPSELQILYSVLGSRRLDEQEVNWLEGYENSRPVRLGNAAYKQFQLDVYGEVIDLLHVCRRKGLWQDDPSWQLEMSIFRFLEEAWARPDNGIWEVRGPQRHFTNSKFMAWVVFDRAIKALESGNFEGPIDRWRQIRETIHKQVCEQGFNRELGSFVQSYGSDALDASLLMMPLVGFLPADDPRVKGTVDAIERSLLHDGFVRRYATQKVVEQLPSGEGAFLPCSFWYVDNLALQGRNDEAAEMFERLLSIRNDVGLLSEEYDPKEKRLLGNFPQAFSHVGLVNSAHNLAMAEGPAKHRAKNPAGGAAAI
ncbi:MAG TPA: glycoside hydrolase family 15 protein [Lacipirellulaceae bacterium]|nr:glycoside hydrolase family 15 protein [Lacipirellulaceae bacterium]